MEEIPLPIPTLMKCYSHVNSVGDIHRHFYEMTIHTEQDRIAANYCYALALLPKLMSERGYNGLLEWKYSISDIHKGGLCRSSKKTIIVSEWFLEDPVTKFEDIYDLILHEIAHANMWHKLRDVSHDIDWKHEVLSIGGSARECMPEKYYMATEKNFDTIVYNCGHVIDKCVCVLVIRKSKLEQFMDRGRGPKFICIKHQSPFEISEVRGYVKGDDKRKQIGGFSKRLFGTRMGKVNGVYHIEDGELLEEVGNTISKFNPHECILYD